MSDPKPTVVGNPWQALRQFTSARIALGRSGVSLPTAAQLEFQLAHAAARDAVHLALDVESLCKAVDAEIDAGTGAAAGNACIALASAAPDRQIYLQRPDLGRRLDAASRAALQKLQNIWKPHIDDGHGRACKLAIVIADGLSALAIERHALPFLQALRPKLESEEWMLAPITVVCQGRVAVGDEMGELLGADIVVVLIGERPGLSSPDSMGLYLTWAPRVGLTDESRNCISNIRPAGLSYQEAAFKLHYLMTQARQRRLSGVRLKDDTGGTDDIADTSGNTRLPGRNFLLDDVG